MIRLEDVCYKSILQNLRLSLLDGEIVSILGPNGAGKTSLMKLLAHIDSPSKGVLEIELGEVSYVSQSSPNLLGLKVSDLIEGYWYKKGHVLRDDILRNSKKSFSFFECEHLFNRKLDELSGGELQKVMLASAISTGPRILLLDEPMSGLDPYQYEFSLMKLKKWQREHNSLIVHISHDINQALLFSDRIIGLKEGKILFDKSSEEVELQDLRSLFGVGFKPTEKENDRLQVKSGFLGGVS